MKAFKRKGSDVQNPKKLRIGRHIAEEKHEFPSHGFLKIIHLFIYFVRHGKHAE